MKIISAILGVALVTSASIFGMPASSQDIDGESFLVAEKSFAEPEDAIMHFVGSIAANELTAAFQAFAVNDYAEKYDFKAMAMRMGAIAPMFMKSPGDIPMYDQMNRLALLAEYGGQIRNFSYSFHSTIPLDQNFRVTAPEEIDGFAASVDPAKLAGLEIAEAHRLVGFPDKYAEIMKKQAAPIGADEMADFFVLYELDGQFYSGGIHLLRYGDAWKLDGLNSPLAGTDATGVVTPVTAEEFAAHLADMQAEGQFVWEKVSF